MLKGVWDWVWDLLGWTKTEEGNVLLLGLDNAGKTTLLYYMRDGLIRSFEPTRTLNKESIKINNIMFNTIDLGGQENLRLLWEEYFCDVCGVMFMIDASDRRRFPESKKVLDSLLKSRDLETKPFMVLVNKIDKRDAVGPNVITRDFGLEKHLSRDSGESEEKSKWRRPVGVFPISMLRKSNLEKPFQWFSDQIRYNKYKE